jgi:hypothetical protein
MEKYKPIEIKTFLRGQPKIKFASLAKPEELTPREFVKNFFKYNSLNTVYLNNQIQTEGGKRRSVGDIFRITYFYFPKVKLRTIYEALLESISENKVLSSICTITGTRVYRKTNNNEKGIFNGQGIDEFKTDFSKFEIYPLLKPKPGFWGDNYGEKQLKFVKI